MRHREEASGAAYPTHILIICLHFIQLGNIFKMNKLHELALSIPLFISASTTNRIDTIDSPVYISLYYQSH